jgi:hypothetical protein
MAYTQTPGRGNLDKTGNGIPSEFKQDNEPQKPTNITASTKIETTPKYASDAENYQNNLVTRNQGRNDIGINLATAEASAKKFERKVVNEPDGMTRIIGEGGQTFYGRTSSKETKSAINASNKKVEETNMRRQSNANHWNVNAGVKPVAEFTQRDKEMVVNMGKAKVASK